MFDLFGMGPLCESFLHPSQISLIFPSVWKSLPVAGGDIPPPMPHTVPPQVQLKPEMSACPRAAKNDWSNLCNSFIPSLESPSQGSFSHTSLNSEKNCQENVAVSVLVLFTMTVSLLGWSLRGNVGQERRKVHWMLQSEKNERLKLI